MTAETRPKLIIVDDDEAMRRSMTFLFASVGLEAETHATADAFLAKLATRPPEGPGAVILDVRMPGMSGIELQRRLADDGFPLPVLIVTGHGDVPMAVEALKAGAFDFIEKPFKEQYLLDAVEKAIRRSQEILTRDARLRSLSDRHGRLGRREREVLARVVEGKPNKVIAHELELSIKTIEAYRASIMSKMEADSLADLVRMTSALEPGSHGE